MFSWSSSATTTTRRNNYPGQRLQNDRAAANATEGSIRPPSSSFTRAQHLQSYLEDATLQRSTRRVSSDDTTYDTVFQTTQGDTLILRVNIQLTSSFASSCPAMSLAGVRVRHPWIEERHARVTGYDPIHSERTWNSSGLLLGQAVHAVVKHFQLNPPEILEITDKGLQSIQTNKKQQHSSKQQPPQQQQQPQSNNGNSRDDAPPSYHAFANLPPAPDVPMPTIPRSYPVIEDYSRDELDTLLKDELDFLSLVHKLETFHQIQEIRSERLDENVETAQANLQHELQLKTAMEEVHQLQETLKKKVVAFQQLEAEQDALCAPPDLRSTLKLLNKASKQSEEESEAFAEDWVENGGDVDAFIKAFVEQRKIHHRREAKMEVLQEQQAGKK